MEYLAFSLKPPACPECFHYINLSWQLDFAGLQKQHQNRLDTDADVDSSVQP